MDIGSQGIGKIALYFLYRKLWSVCYFLVFFGIFLFQSVNLKNITLKKLLV